MFDKSRDVPEALYDWIVWTIEAVFVDCSWIEVVGFPGDFAVTGVEISEDIWFFPVGLVSFGLVSVGSVTVVLVPIGLVPVGIPGVKVESVLHTRHFSVGFFEEVSISVEHGAVETTETISDNTEEAVSQETVPEEREEELEEIPPEEIVEENLEIVPEEIAEEALEDIVLEERDGETEDAVPEEIAEESPEDIVPEEVSEEALEDIVPVEVSEEALEDIVPEKRDGEIELVSEFDIAIDEVGKSWVKDGIWIIIVSVPPGPAV